MKLYVCWTTRDTPGPHRHACTRAYDALRDAGHDRRSRGPTASGPYRLPADAGAPRGETAVGQSWVPLLVTDEDE